MLLSASCAFTLVVVAAFTTWEDTTSMIQMKMQIPGLAPTSKKVGMLETNSPPARRIAVVMSTDQTIIPWTIAAWKCYCAFHGYTFIHTTQLPETKRISACTKDSFIDAQQNIQSLCVGRSSLLLDYFKDYDYLVQVGSDTVVVNRTFRFEQFLDGDPDVVIPQRVNNQQAYDWMPSGAVAVTDKPGKGCCAILDPSFTSNSVPRDVFPHVPTPVLWPAMLHTELIVVKTSASGRRFIQSLVNESWNLHFGAGCVGGYDMTGIQRAAMDFINPKTPQVKATVDFLDALGRGSCASVTNYQTVFGGDGFFGYQGPWCANTTMKLHLYYREYIVYNLTTSLISSQRDWQDSQRGHLRILGEGEIIRDWGRGPLLAGGDFVVHSKWVSDPTFATSDYNPDHCSGDAALGSAAVGGNFLAIPMTPSLDWFTDAESSQQLALKTGFSKQAMFEKYGVNISYDSLKCNQLGGPCWATAPQGQTRATATLTGSALTEAYVKPYADRAYLKAR